MTTPPIEPVTQLTDDEKAQLLDYVRWVVCSCCNGESVHYALGQGCVVCGQDGRILNSTANRIGDLLMWYKSSRPTPAPSQPDYSDVISGNHMDIIRTLAGIRNAPSQHSELADEGIEVALRRAYHQGAEDVHFAWRNGDGQNQPDFYEAACDYASSIDLSALRQSPDKARLDALEEVIAALDDDEVAEMMDCNKVEKYRQHKATLELAKKAIRALAKQPT
jgi:hypothetical protein